MSKGAANGDDSTEIIVILVAIGLMIAVMMFNKYFYVFADVWRWVRIVELYPLSWIPSWVPVFGEMDIGNTVDYLLATPGTDLTKDFVSELDKYYWKRLSWLPALIILYLAFKLISKTDNVSLTYNMETLLKDRAQFYPFLERFVDVRPESMDIYYTRGSKESKEFAMAMTPSFFAEMSPPLGLERQAKKNPSLKKPIWNGEMEFDTDLAERAFTAQLGRKYEGIESLNVTETRLYNELKSKIKCSPGEAREFIQTCVYGNLKDKNPKNFTSVERKIFHSIASKITSVTTGRKKISKDQCMKKQFLNSIYKDTDIRKIINQRKAEQVMGRHAYIRTGLMSMLEEGRNSGVIPSLWYRGWLKGADRTLWYCISTVGRRVSFVECAGVFAHWLLEKELVRPVPHIFVNEAIDGLYAALRIEDREKFDRSKKKQKL